MSVNLTVSSAPHIRGNDNTRKIMLDVLIALVPALIAAVYFYGERALVLTVIVVEVPFLAEMFGFMELPMEALAAALGLAFLIIPIMEVYKAVMRGIEKNQD